MQHEKLNWKFFGTHHTRNSTGGFPGGATRETQLEVFREAPHEKLESGDPNPDVAHCVVLTVHYSLCITHCALLTVQLQIIATRSPAQIMHACLMAGIQQLLGGDAHTLVIYQRSPTRIMFDSACADVFNK